jgi:hypothetical protein
MLMPDLGTKGEQEFRKGDKFYYFSTTRHKLGGYNLNPHREGVMFVLDGTKLGNNYAGAAMDFHKKFSFKPRHEREAEDRIYSHKPEIPNALKYIQAAHIYYTDDFNHNIQLYRRTLRRMLIILKKNNIPHYIYNDVNAWLTHNKEKALKDYKIPDTFGFEDDMYVSNSEDDMFDSYMELWYKNKSADLTKKGKDELKRLRIYYRDFIDRLSNYIHNYRMHSNKRPAMDRMIKLIQKSKSTSVEEFAMKLKEKWDKIVGLENEEDMKRWKEKERIRKEVK